MIKYYVQTDESGAIIAHSSDMALAPDAIEAGGWKSIPDCIEGEIIRDGVPLFKLKSGKPVTRTAAEINAGMLEIVVKPLIASKIEESKAALAAFLAANPLISTAHGGKPAAYSVINEKQTLLTSTILMAQGAELAGIPFPIEWNATGQPCEPWTFEELKQLAFEIAGYVRPFVSQQRNLEVALKECVTVEAVEAIEIDYTVILEAMKG